MFVGVCLDVFVVVLVWVVGLALVVFLTGFGSCGVGIIQSLCGVMAVLGGFVVFWLVLWVGIARFWFGV